MKIISSVKHHKKIFCGALAVVVIGSGLGLCYGLCPEAQFRRACKDEKICAYAVNRLTPAEKKSFVKIAKYMKGKGTTTLDNDILKEISAAEIEAVNAKMTACTADVARQNLLDKMAPREHLPGNYDCLRQVYINRLSNDEVLFLQSPQASNLESLKNPAVRDAYIRVSSKIMQCMNAEVQAKYLEELQSLVPQLSPQVKQEKSKTSSVEKPDAKQGQKPTPKQAQKPQKKK